MVNFVIFNFSVYVKEIVHKVAFKMEVNVYK
jgi:hypothetical protein